MAEQLVIVDGAGDLGGTMRLGSYEAVLTPGSVVAQTYGSELVTERHRHRYEVNNHYVDRLESAGLIVSARTPSENLCEMIELPKSTHPWFVGCQFHPEFTSSPRSGHPLFTSFVRAAIDSKAGK